MLSTRTRRARLRLAGTALLAMVTAAAGYGSPVGASAAPAARPSQAARTTVSPDPHGHVPRGPVVGPGRLDPTFGTRGVTITRFPGQAKQANDLVVLHDGSIVAVGGARAETAEFVLVKYHCDGTLDTRFGTGGRVVTPLPNPGSSAQAVARAPKGRLVVVGTAGLGQPDEFGFAVARYLPNGKLDPRFGNHGLVIAPIGPRRHAAANDVVVLPDGRILVAGGANDALGRPGFAAARFLPDGRLDPSFGTGGWVVVRMPGGDAAATALAVRRDGRIVLGGTANIGGASFFALAGLTRNGKIDRSFGALGRVVQRFPNAGVNGINDLAIDKRGRIVAAGVTGNVQVSTSFGLMRFLPNGRLDRTFGGTGKVRTTFDGFAAATGVLLRRDGRIVAVGQAFPNVALVGYLPNGELDRKFGDNGRTITPVGQVSAAQSAAFQFGKRIVIAGVTGNETLSDAAFLVARYGLIRGHLPKCCERIPSVNGLG